MKKMIVLLSMVTTAGTAQAPVNWAIDNSHSQVMFTVSHLVISEVTGNFKGFSGSIVSSKDDFSDASVTFAIDVKTINTDNEMRDNHLKGDEFFNAEKYPQMTFKGTGLKKISGNKYTMTGDLTIRDVTKPVTLDVTYFGTANDPWGNTKAGFKIKTTINRFDYNLKWNTLTEAGGAVVGQDVEITANLELAKPK
ncbi:MAG: YceI family protein [Bacteroidia bacterium]|jgi:polyisoprenoid-binding protein YceI|nr:YceI family protein [Bacteroidia bacterium]